jgi:CHASE3 domain sensor protein
VILVLGCRKQFSTAKDKLRDWERLYKEHLSDNSEVKDLIQQSREDIEEKEAEYNQVLKLFSCI